MDILNLLKGIVETTNKLAYEDFATLYCAILEDWCNAHHEDPSEVIGEIATLVTLVNKKERDEH